MFSFGREVLVFRSLLHYSGDLCAQDEILRSESLLPSVQRQSYKQGGGSSSGCWFGEEVRILCPRLWESVELFWAEKNYIEQDTEVSSV